MNNPNHHLFRFCPGCGENLFAPAGDKSFVCSSCDFKLYINVAAAGIALIFNEHQHVLATKRKYDPCRGMLDFPGGFAEPGESMETCLTREIKEELNLDITEMTYYCTAHSQYLYQQVLYPILDMVFICRVVDFSGISAGDDVDSYTFIPVSRLDPSLFGLTSPKTVIKTLQKNRVRGNLS